MPKARWECLIPCLGVFEICELAKYRSNLRQNSKETAKQPYPLAQPTEEDPTIGLLYNIYIYANLSGYPPVVSKPK